eukprot:COSAG02_NODE_56392_length_285_cov_12.908602_1_plen_39_part_10
MGRSHEGRMEGRHPGQGNIMQSVINQNEKNKVSSTHYSH